MISADHLDEKREVAPVPSSEQGVVVWDFLLGSAITMEAFIQLVAIDCDAEVFQARVMHYLSNPLNATGVKCGQYF